MSGPKSSAKICLMIIRETISAEFADVAKRTKENLLRIGAIATSIGALAIPAAFASSETSPQMKYVGVATNEIWVEDSETAQAKAKLIADLGANAVRIFQPYSPGQAAEIKNDEERLCNAAEAAKDNDLTLFITMTGYKRNGEVGFAPLTASGWKRFADTIGTVMWTLAGPNGCAKEVPELNIGILNEVNSKKFFPQEYKDSSISPAARYEAMLETIYPRLKDEAIKITDELKQYSEKPDKVEPITVNVIAGELASVHNLLGFIKEMGEAKRNRGYNEPIFDTIAIHPYMENSSVSPDVPHPDGSIIGIADYDKLAPVVKKYFGEVPILYDELGVETITPPYKRYTGSSPASVKPVAEAVQAIYIRKALAMVACQPRAAGLFNFLSADERNLKGWQSGIYYYDGDAKTSLPKIRQAFLDSRAGTIGNC